MSIKTFAYTARLFWGVHDELMDAALVDIPGAPGMKGYEILWNPYDGGPLGDLYANGIALPAASVTVRLFVLDYLGTSLADIGFYQRNVAVSVSVDTTALTAHLGSFTDVAGQLWSLKVGLLVPWTYRPKDEAHTSVNYSMKVPYEDFVLHDLNIYWAEAFLGVPIVPFTDTMPQQDLATEIVYPVKMYEKLQPDVRSERTWDYGSKPGFTLTDFGNDHADFVLDQGSITGYFRAYLNRGFTKDSTDPHWGGFHTSSIGAYVRASWNSNTPAMIGEYKPDTYNRYYKRHLSPYTLETYINHEDPLKRTYYNGPIETYLDFDMIYSRFGMYGHVDTSKWILPVPGEGGGAPAEDLLKPALESLQASVGGLTPYVPAITHKEIKDRIDAMAPYVPSEPVEDLSPLVEKARLLSEKRTGSWSLDKKEGILTTYDSQGAVLAKFSVRDNPDEAVNERRLDLEI